MIPAKTSCPGSWTKEYDGYIMASSTTTTYTCVDSSFEPVPGTEGNPYVLPALLNHVEGAGALGNPPYDSQKELNCVVCTK